MIRPRGNQAARTPNHKDFAMLEVLLGVLMFTLVVLALVVLILAAKAK